VPIIRAENLTRRFGERTAVDGLTLEVEKGEVFGLLGPDGAGKTTTLRMLCGLLDASAGAAWVADYNAAENADAVKDHIGYMAQRFGLYGDLTVEENMLFYSDLFGITGAERDRLMAKYLEMTRMGPFRNRLEAKLSGGMKQKLALMCTLLHKPEVLFLDEPTNGVDPVSRRDFWTILYQLVEGGMTVFVTTAYLDEAERCDRVALMNQGRLIRSGTPDQLKSSLDEVCYEVKCAAQRAARERLQSQAGVLSVEPAGAALHMFLAPDVPLEPLRSLAGAGCSFERITPSLEDVFIALIRKEEQSAGKRG